VPARSARAMSSIDSGNCPRTSQTLRLYDDGSDHPSGTVAAPIRE
jgi:hypothetical protein